MPRSRRILYPLALAAIVALAFGAWLRAPAGGAAVAAASPVAGAPGDPPARTVSVGGLGLVTVKPDLAFVVFGVETLNADLAAAQGENSTRMAAVTARLKALGVEEQDLATTGYGVYPQYDRDQRVNGYRVSNGVRATVRDINSLGAKIDAAVAAGANRVGSIGFDLSNKDDAIRRAREAAVADAHARAEQYARLTGVTLGGPVTIVEGEAAAPQYRKADTGAAPAAGAAAPSTPIETGEGTVSLTVQITYEIK